MNFHQKLSAYNLGFLSDKDLPGIAMSGLEEGYDSESLRILAGHTSDNPFMLNDYFLKAMNELNIVPRERKEALVTFLGFYAKNIVDKKVDTYDGFEEMNKIINQTAFDWEDIGLMSCYVDYITIWEEKMDGLDFHTADGLTKEQYIEKTKGKMREHLEQWLCIRPGF